MRQKFRPTFPASFLQHSESLRDPSKSTHQCLTISGGLSDLSRNRANSPRILAPPSGAVLDTREIADDKRFEERKIRQIMKHPVGGYVMSGWPACFAGEPPAMGPAPLHDSDVLTDCLHMSSAQPAICDRGKSSASANAST